MRRTSSFVLAVTCVLATACASGRFLGSSDDGARAVTDAERLVETNSFAEAMPLFEKALASEGLRPGDRDRALYATAMLKLSSDPALRDLATARTRLQDLQSSSPGHRRLEVYTALSWLTERAALEEATQQALAARDAAFDAERRQLQAQIAEARAASEKAAEQARSTAQDQVGTLRDELNARQREVVALRAELAAAQAAVKQKDEALRRLARRALRP
jgi:hypothetical protein